MGFINEVIKADDVKRFNIKEIDSRFDTEGLYSSTWTVDRDRNMYLRCVASTRDEQYTRSSWTFYWYGELLLVVMELLKNRDMSDGSQHLHWKLCDITEFDRNELSADLEEQRAEILEDLKLALSAYEAEDDVFTEEEILADEFQTEDERCDDQINNDHYEDQTESRIEIQLLQSMNRIQSLRNRNI